MNEELARKKWCRHGRTMHGLVGGVNRMGNDGRVPMTMCIGSECMDWIPTEGIVECIKCKKQFTAGDAKCSCKKSFEIVTDEGRCGATYSYDLGNTFELSADKIKPCQ